MDIEKPQEIYPNKEKPRSEITNLSLPREERIPYLSFSEKEKNMVLEKIAAEQPNNSEDNKINFLAEQLGIEDLIYEYPRGFETKRLTEVALNNSEFALKLIKEIAKRKDYAQLEQILQHYKDKPTFEYCVREIESSLKGDEMQDNVLMALSEALTETEEDQRVAFKKFSEYMLKKPEKAARNLSTYLKFLGLKDEEIKKLLDKKSLLLIGGGIAPIKDEFLKRGIDCNVTNIEPLLKDEHRGNSDQPIPKNFYDVGAEDIQTYDEIWSANNSLPTYAFNPEQVKIFYQKALSAIKPGGYLRIVPVSGFSDAITPSMRLNRIPTNNESIRNIEMLKKRPDLFTVEEFETPPFKTIMGEKEKMKGVNIKVVGDENQIKEFLESIK